MLDKKHEQQKPFPGGCMADYKYASILELSNDEVFDLLYRPATAAPYSGIYRCEECGREAASIKDKELPSQNHHQHRPNQGPILWRLIVRREL
jgi:hypothetical protein